MCVVCVHTHTCVRVCVHACVRACMRASVCKGYVLATARVGVGGWVSGNVRARVCVLVPVAAAGLLLDVREDF